MYLEYGEPVEQILAEASRGNLFRQITVGRSNNTHIHMSRLGISNLYIFTRFEDTQKFSLQLKSHFTDLIQKDSTVISFLKQPFLVFQRTSKRTGFMTEHFTFQQLLTERRAIDSNETLSGTFTIIMYGLCKDLFSRTCFTRQ